MTNLILFGFKGSGKTYLGSKLARRAERNFLDTDHLIEVLMEAKCADIYRSFGENYFRDLEKEVIFSLGSVQRSIIALGGGAILGREQIVFLQKLGTLVYLKAEKEVLKKRLEMGSKPAFLKEKTFDEVFEERAPLYAAIPAITLELAGKGEDQILEQLQEILDGK